MKDIQTTFEIVKKAVEDLFDETLKMKFCTERITAKTKWGDKSLNRYYIKLDEEIIWDFPADFNIKDIHYECFDNKNIILLVQEYLDTDHKKLLKKKFRGENDGSIIQYLGSDYQDYYDFDYRLTELFIASDSRLKVKKMSKWASKKKNPAIDKILTKRFGMTK